MLLYYLLAVNIVAFSLMGVDKTKARQDTRRIPEKVLFFVAMIGGSLGAIVGMFAFRHKTKHLSFVIGLPVILLLHLVAAVWLTT